MTINPPLAVMLGAGAALLAGGVFALLSRGQKQASFAMPSTGRTDDWSQADLVKLLDFCSALGIGDCTIPLRVWANESDNKTTAHNPNGNASGLFQLMPATARGLGYDVDSDPTLAAYRELSVSQQLDWALKYYMPHRGNIGTVARFYVANFLPAELSHADDMSWDLTSSLSPSVYNANSGFDRDNKGYITPQDLVDASVRATGPRTNELITRLQAAGGIA